MPGAHSFCPSPLPKGFTRLCSFCPQPCSWVHPFCFKCLLCTTCAKGSPAGALLFPSTKYVWRCVLPHPQHLVSGTCLFTSSSLTTDLSSPSEFPVLGPAPTVSGAPSSLGRHSSPCPGLQCLLLLNNEVTFSCSPERAPWHVESATSHGASSELRPKVAIPPSLFSFGKDNWPEHQHV